MLTRSGQPKHSSGRDLQPDTMNSPGVSGYRWIARPLSVNRVVMCAGTGAVSAQPPRPKHDGALDGTDGFEAVTRSFW